MPKKEKPLKMVDAILSHSSLCTGCRACEVACGFRSSGDMDPSRACILAQKDEATGKMDIRISEHCDVCRGHETPFCIQVCHPRALSLGRRKS